MTDAPPLTNDEVAAVVEKHYMDLYKALPGFAVFVVVHPNYGGGRHSAMCNIERPYLASFLASILAAEVRNTERELTAKLPP